jgi:two-component system, response regulator PdtaR
MFFEARLSEQEKKGYHTRMKKVLIVEDETFSVISLEHLCRDWGYEVCKSAATGEEAVIRAEEDRPDIIIMDINLAGELDGIEAAKQITGLYKTAFIFFTGYSDESLKKESEKLNTIAYIQKPVNFDHLKTIIGSAFK